MIAIVKFRIDKNYIHYYGNPAGYVRDGKAVVDSLFQNDELTAFLTGQEGLEVEWREGLYEKLAAGAVPGERLKAVRVWQMGADTDVMARFIGYEQRMAKGYAQPETAEQAPEPTVQQQMQC